MTIALFAAVLLAFLAVYNAREFLQVYNTHGDRAKFMELHSQIGEGAELVAFIITGILLYLMDFNLIIVAIALILGLAHVQPTITSTEAFAKMHDNVLDKMPRFVMLLTATEVVVSIFILSKVMPLL